MEQNDINYIPKTVKIGICFWLDGRCHNQVISCYADTIYVNNKKIWDVEETE